MAIVHLWSVSSWAFVTDLLITYLMDCHSVVMCLWLANFWTSCSICWCWFLPTLSPPAHWLTLLLWSSCPSSSAVPLGPTVLQIPSLNSDCACQKEWPSMDLLIGPLCFKGTPCPGFGCLLLDCTLCIPELSSHCCSCPSCPPNIYYLPFLTISRTCLLCFWIQLFEYHTY